ncbi:hypothetical protein LZ31DRAFT_196547 [Colletotrichum somersetense]|nr:hypothetical protein LZ31DRAFT_196547 [Colletotrichum somersetense]
MLINQHSKICTTTDRRIPKTGAPPCQYTQPCLPEQNPPPLVGFLLSRANPARGANSKPDNKTRTEKTRRRPPLPLTPLFITVLQKEERKSSGFGVAVDTNGLQRTARHHTQHPPKLRGNPAYISRACSKLSLLQPPLSQHTHVPYPPSNTAHRIQYMKRRVLFLQYIPGRVLMANRGSPPPRRTASPSPPLAFHSPTACPSTRQRKDEPTLSFPLTTRSFRGGAPDSAP